MSKKNKTCHEYCTVYSPLTRIYKDTKTCSLERQNLCPCGLKLSVQKLSTSEMFHLPERYTNITVRQMSHFVCWQLQPEVSRQRTRSSRAQAVTKRPACWFSCTLLGLCRRLAFYCSYRLESFKRRFYSNRKA